MDATYVKLGVEENIVAQGNVAAVRSVLDVFVGDARKFLNFVYLGLMDAPFAIDGEADGVALKNVARKRSELGVFVGKVKGFLNAV